MYKKKWSYGHAYMDAAATGSRSEESGGYKQIRIEI